MNRIVTLLLSTLLMIGLNVATTGVAAAGLGSVSHKVVRSDSSKAASTDKHEFNGGSHVYFSTINEPSAVMQWLEEKSDTDTYQEGWARLYLDWPVHLKSIVLRKASVGDKPFQDGWVKIEVQTIKGKWINVFDRRGKDVKKAISISKGLKAIGPTRSVRIMFKSPARMTVGPIDLNF